MKIKCALVCPWRGGIFAQDDTMAWWGRRMAPTLTFQHHPQPDTLPTHPGATPVRQLCLFPQNRGGFPADKCSAVTGTSSDSGLAPERPDVHRQGWIPRTVLHHLRWRVVGGVRNIADALALSFQPLLLQYWNVFRQDCILFVRLFFGIKGLYLVFKNENALWHPNQHNLTHYGDIRLKKSILRNVKLCENVLRRNSVCFHSNNILL